MYRKFLLYKDENLSKLIEDRDYIAQEIFFTEINKCKSICFVHEKNSYKKVVKGFDSKIVEIDKKEYKARKKEAITKSLKKKIFDIDSDKKVIIYDKLAFLELNLKNFDELKEFYESDFFKTYIDEDITNNINYSEISLAKFGENSINIYTLFNKIKCNRREEVQRVIYKDMNSANAIRIELFLLYTMLIKNRKEIFSKSENGEDILSKYRKNLYKIIVLLKEYKKIFEKDLVKQVLRNLKLIYSHTDVHKDIVSIRENFALLQECLKEKSFNKFLKNKDEKITSQIDSFVSFLKTREYAIILKQLELLIKEGSLDENLDLEDSIEKSLSKKIKKAKKKFKKSFSKNIDCDSVDGIEKIIKRYKKVKVLEDEFSYLLERSNKTIFEKLKLDLYSYRNLLKLEDILKNSVTKEKHIECLNKEIKDKKSKLLKSLKKSFKKI